MPTPVPWSTSTRMGVGAEKFRGVFDNTEIYHKLAELTKVQ